MKTVNGLPRLAVTALLTISLCFWAGVGAIATSLVYADTDNPSQLTERVPLSGFEITGGSAKDSESTFDSARVIVGTAEKDTVVTIVVLSAGKAGNSKETTYALTVGSSGMFNQKIELAVGDNQISITAAKGNAYAEYSALIKRKDASIKKKLENGIILPGQSLDSLSPFMN